MYIPSNEETKGMSRMEVWIVYWAGCCTKRELRAPPPAGVFWAMSAATTTSNSSKRFTANTPSQY